jgi:hypothetical protein
MVRTGELLGHEPGLNFKYLESASGDPWNFQDQPSLADSTGGAMDLAQVDGPLATIQDNGICLMCHDQKIAYYRAPGSP